MIRSLFSAEVIHLNHRSGFSDWLNANNQAKKKEQSRTDELSEIIGSEAKEVALVHIAQYH